MSMSFKPPAVAIATDPAERPESARPRLFGDAGSPPSSDPTMWWHLCSHTKDMEATGKGEACSFCGREEPKP